MSRTAPLAVATVVLLIAQNLQAQTAARPMPDATFEIDGATMPCNAQADCLIGINANSQVECILTPGGPSGTCYVHRNRYISIDPNPANAGTLTARRVLLDVGGGQTALLGWVSSPVPKQVIGPEPSPQYVARIVDVPHYADWNSVGGGDTVNVGDCEVSPDHAYILQAIAFGADTGIEANYSDPLVLATVQFWADVTGSGFGQPPDTNRNFKDINAIGRGMSGAQTEPVAWLDLVPEVPDFAVTQEDLDAMGPGYPYPEPLAYAMGVAAAPPLPEASFDFTIVCTDDLDCGSAAGTACIYGICYAMKNRYVSIDPNPDNDGLVTARRVRLYPGGVEPPVLGWVGEPVEIAVGGEVGTQLLARIVFDPYYRNWSVDDAGRPWTDPTVHIGDCETSPGHVYVVQSILEGADVADEANYSNFLPIPTVRDFGDVVGPAAGTPADGVRNFRDISAVVQGFQGAPTEPKTWLDLRGGSSSLEVPDFSDINFFDINSAVAGFQGEGYPYCQPMECSDWLAECHP